MADQMQILKWARTLGSILPLQAPNLHSVKLAPFCSAAETSTLWSLHLCSFVLVVKKLQCWWHIWLGATMATLYKIWWGQWADLRWLWCWWMPRADWWWGARLPPLKLLPSTYLPGVHPVFLLLKEPQKNLVLSLLEIFLLLHSAY